MTTEQVRQIVESGRPKDWIDFRPNARGRKRGFNPLRTRSLLTCIREMEEVERREQKARDQVKLERERRPRLSIKDRRERLGAEWVRAEQLHAAERTLARTAALLRGGR